MPNVPRRRRQNVDASADARTAVELTEHFIEDVNRRLTRIERGLLIRWLVVVVALMLAGAVFVSVLARNSETIDKLNKDRVALCLLRADLRARVADLRVRLAQGQEFLRAHPHGIPGIPYATLRVSIDAQKANIVNERRSLIALQPLICPPER